MVWGGSLMLSPPPAQGIRLSGSGRGAVQVGEEIGVINWARNTVSLL